MNKGQRMKTEKRRWTRLVSALLTAVMLFALLPTQAMAGLLGPKKLPWETVRSYVSEPFYDVSEDMDLTYSGVLALMDREIEETEQH